MKQTIVALLLLIIVSFNCCNKNTQNNTFTDSEFLEYISDTNLRPSLQKIDSLIKYEDYSDKRRAILFHEKGRLLATLEKDVEAIGSLNEALYLFQKESNKEYLAKTNMLLGDSYAMISKQDTAAIYTNTAYNFFKEIGDKKGEAKTLNSLGHLSFLAGDYNASIAHVKKAIDLQIALNDKETLSASYNNLGFILEQTENYDEAISYYEKAIEINNKIDRLNTNALRNLGYVHLIQDDPKKCIAIYQKALKIEERTEHYLIQQEIYEVLVEAAVKDEDFKSIPELIRKKDSVTQLLTSYESEEKMKLINRKNEQFIEQENLKKELELNKKNKIILGAILSFLLALGLYVFQKNRNSRLELKQQKLELEQKILRTQMNPHFVFNALTAIQKTFFDEDPIKSSTYLTRFAKLVRQNFDVVNKKRITLEEDLDILKNYIETQQLRFENKFDYEINISDDIEVSIIKLPPMLLQPFIENSIEHGLKPKNEKGLLQINITEQEKYTHIEIIDNGIGYNKEKVRDNREHAIDIFLKRLKLRDLGEEKKFSIKALDNNKGTKVSIFLDLRP
ncbi:tetratricopeptide repeat protein [Maribacter sp. SA7]|uniref:tetratricopeptide repeat-containing sensor histidine kinase n=1 Tax=Maribacter zhoushanensis TaxID=3030012 RepID=UPI0023EB2E21|nr:tetratricopeptide repeat protein [Maribacter zhoushanensis]MDF4202559.1 tetratricopeptide repeat protein [Maribacter zhoushanensis]